MDRDTEIACCALEDYACMCSDVEEANGFVQLLDKLERSEGIGFEKELLATLNQHELCYLQTAFGTFSLSLHT